MVARSYLRHDPAEFFVRGNVRGDFAGKQFVLGVIVASAQHRHGGLITGGFKCQDGFHNKQNTRVILSGAKDLTPSRWSTLSRSREIKTYGRSLAVFAARDDGAFTSLPLPLSARSVAHKS